MKLISPKHYVKKTKNIFDSARIISYKIVVNFESKKGYQSFECNFWHLNAILYQWKSEDQKKFNPQNSHSICKRVSFIVFALQYNKIHRESLT